MAYGWTKRNYKLTKDQRERGVIFSSVLINHTTKEEPVLYEVFEDDPDKYEKINNLAGRETVRWWKNLARDAGWNYEMINRS